MLGRVVELIAPVVRICVVRRSSRDGIQRYRPVVLRKDGAGQIALCVSRKVDILLILFATCALAFLVPSRRRSGRVKNASKPLLSVSSRSSHSIFLFLAAAVFAARSAIRAIIASPAFLPVAARGQRACGLKV